MAVNKVVYGNQTLIDLSTDTVASSDDILLGKVGHLRDGSVVTGTASGGDQHGTIWQDGQGYVHLDDESGIALQSKTATPTESQQVIEADQGYYALDTVTVGAISSSYVGSGVSRRSSSDLTANGATVTAPAGYYSAQASKSVATGTAGTPTATKGTVSNHAVTVTPSVTNTAGYISGGTKTGTGVTVSAYELVSGTKSITENGTGIDVTNYASVNVSVPSDDFIITFTQNQSGNWEPNCTYTEAYNAYSAGKTIAGRTNATEGVGFEFDNDNIYYTISEFYDSSDGTGVKQTQYVWHFGGITNQGETITYDTIFANAIPSDVANGKVFYNAQGIQTGTASSGSSYTYIGSTTYTVSTSSTTAVSVGTFDTGNTSIWTSDKMLYVKIRDTAGRRNGYYYGSDCMFANNAPGNNLSSTSNSLVHGTSYYQNSAGYLINFTLQRTNSNAATQGYGVYAIYVHDDGSIDINARYNSSNTLTIDGTFKVDVYLLDWPGSVSPFNG